MAVGPIANKQQAPLPCRDGLIPSGIVQIGGSTPVLRQLLMPSTSMHVGAFRCQCACICACVRVWVHACVPRPVSGFTHLGRKLTMLLTDRWSAFRRASEANRERVKVDAAGFVA